jgi:3-methyl-2-oxobutanoate hydroxymethyltransferase
MLGLTFNQTPKFARQYANVGEAISSAMREYGQDVRRGAFPSNAESYHAVKMLVELEDAPVNRDGDW